MRYKRTTMLAPEAALATVAVHFYPLISRLQLCIRENHCGIRASIYSRSILKHVPSPLLCTSIVPP